MDLAPSAVTRALPLLVALALLTPHADAQNDRPPSDGSAIGELILSLRDQNDRPIVGTPVVVAQADGTARVAGTTGADGTARVEVSQGAFQAGATLSAFGSLNPVRPFSPRAVMDELYGEGSFDDLLGDVGEAGGGGRGIGVVVLGSRDSYINGECPREPFRTLVGNGAWCADAALAYRGGPPRGEENRVDLRLNGDCESWADRQPVRGRVTGGYLFPVDTEEEPREDREVDFFRPLILQFPDDLGRSTLARVDYLDDCEEEQQEDDDGPRPGLFATHAYNFDFEEGSWGVRGAYPLPLDAPVGVGGGIDYYPEDDVRSLFVYGADLTYHIDMDLLGAGTAYGGVGPRYYVTTFDNGQTSSSNGELGFGAVLGATFPVGPLSVYGDIATDRIFDDFNCLTRVGVGLEFGGRE